MALDAFAKLPDELLDMFGVMTHLHSRGNSECSRDMTTQEIVSVLCVLGVQAGIITPHTCNPSKPYLLDPFGVEVAVLKDVADEVSFNRVQSGFDLRFGLECNTVPSYESGFICELDTTDEVIASLGSTYTIGSLHGDAGQYKQGCRLFDAIAMLCRNPYVDALGHITRYVSDVDINWLSVCRVAAATNTLIELNLNLWLKEHSQNEVKAYDSSSVRFHKMFMDAVAESGAKVVIGIDAHNWGMFPRASVKAGWETTVERCAAFVDAITDAGITKDRVVSANIKQWDEYFSRPKATR